LWLIWPFEAGYNGKSPRACVRDMPAVSAPVLIWQYSTVAVMQQLLPEHQSAISWRSIGISSSMSL